MKRVLKPGGILLLAEPNNLMGYFPLLQCQPRPAPEVVLRQLGFYQTCVLGKKALGWGDTSIGDQLPSMIAALGFKDIKVAQSERQPFLIPPYETEEEQIEIDFLQRFKNDGVWMGFCDDTLNFYEAGGGDKTAFSELLNEAMAWQEKLFDAIQAKTFSGSLSGGFYITAGIKPAT